MVIDELNKPGGTWCSQCAIGQGCRIYDSRPQACRDFLCGYLFWEDNLGDHWFPAQSKMVIASEYDGTRLSIYVDPARPDAWRKAPYYNEIKGWAQSTELREARADAFQVFVCIGAQRIVILPDRDVDLGIVGDDEVIVTARVETPQGPRSEIIKMRKDDPRLAAQQ
jgi:hypothetical protein